MSANGLDSALQVLVEYSACELSTLTRFFIEKKTFYSWVKIEQSKKNRNKEKQIPDQSEGRREPGKIKKWATIFLNATKK